MMKKMYIAIIIGVLAVTGIVSVNLGYKLGVPDGYKTAMTDVQGLLLQSGYDFHWQDYGNGSYQLEVLGPDNKMQSKYVVAVDLTVIHRDRNGNLISSDHGAGTMTNLGKNYTISQIGTTPNATEIALYISQSTDMTGITAASTVLPNEIVSAGLERAAGTFAFNNQTSGGAFWWNVTYTFSATGNIAPLGWGLSFQSITSTGGLATGVLPATVTAGNNLVAYDSTPGVKNMVNGDTLAVTWQISIT